MKDKPQVTVKTLLKEKCQLRLECAQYKASLEFIRDLNVPVASDIAENSLKPRKMDC